MAYNYIMNSDLCRMDHDCGECDARTPETYEACQALNRKYAVQWYSAITKGPCLAECDSLTEATILGIEKMHEPDVYEVHIIIVK